MKRFASGRLRDLFIRYSLTTAAIAALTAVLVPLRGHLSALNIGFLFLLLVVLIAARWGWGPARFAPRIRRASTAPRSPSVAGRRTGNG